MISRKIISLTLGVILIFLALVLLVSGGNLLWWDANVEQDADGYYHTNSVHLKTNDCAIVLKPANINLEPGWYWSLGYATEFKLRISSRTTKPIFIGMAEESKVRSFLVNTQYNELTNIALYPHELKWTAFYGDLEAKVPGLQSFWEKSVTSGEKIQLESDLSDNDMIVVMNEDGAAKIDADAVLALHVPWVYGTAIGFIVMGVIFVVIGIIMLYIFSRPRHT